MGKKNRRQNQNQWADDEPAEPEQVAEVSFSPKTSGKKGKRGKKGKNLTHNGFSTGAFGVLGGGDEDDSMCQVDQNCSDMQNCAQEKFEEDNSYKSVQGEMQYEAAGQDIGFTNEEYENVQGTQDSHVENGFGSQHNGFGGSQHNGFGGSQQNGFGGSRQDGFDGSRQDGFGGSRQDGFGGSRQDGFGGSRQNSISGSRQNSISGSRQNSISGSRQNGFGSNQNGFGGSQQNGFGGSQQNGSGGSQHNGFGGSRQNGFGGSRQNDFGGSQQNSFGGSQQNGFGGSQQNGFGGSQQNGFGGSQQNGFGSNQNCLDGSQQNGFGSNQNCLDGSQQNGFGGSQHNGFGGSQHNGFGGSQHNGFGGSRQNDFGGSQQNDFGGSQQNGFGGSRQNGFGSNQNGFDGSQQNGFGGSQQNDFGSQCDEFGSQQNGFQSRQSVHGSQHNCFESQENELDSQQRNGFGSQQSGVNSHHSAFGSQHSRLNTQQSGFGSYSNGFDDQQNGFDSHREDSNSQIDRFPSYQNGLENQHDGEQNYEDNYQSELGSQLSIRSSASRCNENENYDRQSYSGSQALLDTAHQVSRGNSRNRLPSHSNYDDQYLHPEDNRSRRSSISVSSRMSGVRREKHDERYGTFVTTRSRQPSISSYQGEHFDTASKYSSNNDSAEAPSYQQNVDQFNQMVGNQRKSKYGSCQFNTGYAFLQPTTRSHSKSVHTLNANGDFNKNSENMCENSSHNTYRSNSHIFATDCEEGEGMDGFSENQVPIRSMMNDEKCTNHRLSKLSINTNADEFVLVGGQPPPGVVDGRSSCPAGRSRRSRKMMRSTDFLADHEEMMGGSIRSTSAMSRQSLRSTTEHELMSMGIEEETQENCKGSPDYVDTLSNTEQGVRTGSNQSVENFVKANTVNGEQEIDVPLNSDNNEFFQDNTQFNLATSGRSASVSRSSLASNASKSTKSFNIRQDSKTSLASEAAMNVNDISNNIVKSRTASRASMSGIDSVQLGSVGSELKLHGEDVHIPFNSEINHQPVRSRLNSESSEIHIPFNSELNQQSVRSRLNSESSEIHIPYNSEINHQPVRSRLNSESSEVHIPFNSELNHQSVRSRLNSENTEVHIPLNSELYQESTQSNLNCDNEDVCIPANYEFNQKSIRSRTNSYSENNKIPSRTESRCSSHQNDQLIPSNEPNFDMRGSSRQSLTRNMSENEKLCEKATSQASLVPSNIGRSSHDVQGSRLSLSQRSRSASQYSMGSRMSERAEPFKADSSRSINLEKDALENASSSHINEEFRLRSNIGSTSSIKSKMSSSIDHFTPSRASSKLSINSKNGDIVNEDEFVRSQAPSAISMDDRELSRSNYLQKQNSGYNLQYSSVDRIDTVEPNNRSRSVSAFSHNSRDDVFIPNECAQHRSRSSSETSLENRKEDQVPPVPRSRTTSYASLKSGISRESLGQRARSQANMQDEHFQQSLSHHSRPTSQASSKSFSRGSQQSRTHSHVSLARENDEYYNLAPSKVLSHSDLVYINRTTNSQQQRSFTGVLKNSTSSHSMHRSGILSRASSKCSVSFSQQGLHKEYVDENGNPINYRSRSSSFASMNKENGDDTEENLLIADYNSKMESHWELPTSRCASSLMVGPQSNIPDIVVVSPEDEIIVQDKAPRSQQLRTPPALRKARMRSKSSVDIGSAGISNYNGDEIPRPIIFTDALTPQAIAPKSRIQKDKSESKQCSEIAIQTGETIRLRQMADFSTFESSTDEQPSIDQINRVFSKKTTQHPVAQVLTNFLQQQNNLNQSANKSNHQVTVLHADDNDETDANHNKFIRSNNVKETSNDSKKPWDLVGAVEVVPKEVAAEMRDQVLAESKLPQTPTSCRIAKSKFDEFEKYSREESSYDSPNKRNTTNQSNTSNNSGSYRWVVSDPKKENKVPDVKWSDGRKREPGYTVRQNVRAGKIRDLASMFNDMQHQASKEEAMLKLKSLSNDENNNEEMQSMYHKKMILEEPDHYHGDYHIDDNRKTVTSERKYYPITSTVDRHRNCWYYSNDLDDALLDVNDESERGSVIDRHRTSTPLNDYMDHENMAHQFRRIPSIRADEPPVTITRHISSPHRETQIRSNSSNIDRSTNSFNYVSRGNVSAPPLPSNQYAQIKKYPKKTDDYAEIYYPSDSTHGKYSIDERNKSLADGDRHSSLRESGQFPTDHQLRRRTSRGSEHPSITNSQKSRFDDIIEETVNDHIDNLFQFVDEQPKNNNPPSSKSSLHYSISGYRAMQKSNKVPQDEPPVRFSPSVAPHVSELSECSISRLRKKDSLGSNNGFMSPHRFGGRPADLIASTPKSSPTHRPPPALEESYVSSISEGSRHEERMGEYKRLFNKLVHQIEVCKEQIDMTHKVLLKARKEKKPMQELTAQRSNLITTQKIMLLRRELQHVQGILQLKKQPPQLNHDLRGSMSISNITLFLNRGISQRIGDNSSFAFVVVLKSGCELEATAPVTLLFNYHNSLKLHFAEKISFYNLPIDFSVELEVYVMVLPEMKNDENSCATTIANKCRNLLGPGRKNHSNTGLPVGDFVRCGYLRLNRDTTIHDKFYLDDAQYPLEGTIAVTSSCTSLPPAIEVDYRGFLTMYQSVAGGSWERYWAALRCGSIYFWKYPEEDTMGKPPKAHLQLQSCTKDVIVPCTLDQCARPYAFTIEILVSTAPSVMNKKRIILAADSRDLMCSWIDAINEMLSVIREH